jgi:hypothetical protein
MRSVRIFLVLATIPSIGAVTIAEDGPLGMRMISVPAGEFRMGALNTIPEYRPELRHSLRGRKFSEPDLSRPDGYIELTSTDVQWQDTYRKPWATRLKGRLTAPTTGKVIFTADADTGIRWSVGKETVIDVWAPDAKTQQMMGEGLEVRRGAVELEQGRQ